MGAAAKLGIPKSTLALRLSAQARIVPSPRFAQDAQLYGAKHIDREKDTGRYAGNTARVVRRARYPGVLMQTDGFGRDLNVPPVATPAGSQR